MFDMNMSDDNNSRSPPAMRTPPPSAPGGQPMFNNYQYPLGPVKTEVVDEDRNDSGINSSSPESDHSDNYNYQMNQNFQKNPIHYIYQQMHQMRSNMSAFPGAPQPGTPPAPVTPAATEPTTPPPGGYAPNLPNVPTSSSSANFTQYPSFNSNPLTPPGSEPLVSPKSEDLEETTCSSPGACSLDEFNESNNINMEVPKSNDKKVKINRCKTCGFTATSKTEFWNHAAEHIPESKRLYCTNCNFVTEYKHHLEYHLRNHTGSKPFQCHICKYTCVNKSMLNSHLKSHSDIYRYHCGDCTYATKYCHSLKIHLRKHNHNPGLILDQDGKPDPNPVIDVHGTRRGPRQRRTTDPTNQLPPPPSALPLQTRDSPPAPPLPFNHMLQSQLNFFLLNQMQNGDLASRIHGLYLQNNPHLQQLLQQTQQNLEETIKIPQPPTPSTSHDSDNPDSEVLDLSKNTQPSRNKRKGPACKLIIKPDDSSKSPKLEIDEENNNELNDDSVKRNFNCDHCEMVFGDAVLFNLHMGLHCRNDPFTCNKCGTKCEDRIQFHLHIARFPH